MILKRFKYFIPILLILGAVSLLFANTDIEKDSLLKLISRTSGYKKADYLNDLAYLLRREKPDSAVVLLKQSLEIARKTKNTSQEARAQAVFGYVSMGRNRFNEAEGYFENALAIYESIGMTEQSGQMCQEIGVMNLFVSNYSKANQFFNKAISHFEIVKNINGIVDALTNIGSVYSFLGNYQNALENYSRALELSQQYNFDKSSANLLNNIGTVFGSLNNHQTALDYFHQSAQISQRIGERKAMAYSMKNIGLSEKNLGKNLESIEYFNRALRIETELNDMIGVATTLENIGQVYLKLKDFQKAEMYFEQSLNIQRDIDEKYGIANNLLNLATLFLENKSSKPILPFIEEALETANKIQAKKLIASALKMKYQYYLRVGDTKNALKYCKEYAEIKDSLYTIESANKSAEMQVRFQTEKKERENTILRKEYEIKELEIERQESIRLYILTVLILVAALAVLLLIRFRAKIKTNKLLTEKNNLILSQKEELGKAIDDLKKAQKRIIETEKMASLSGLIAGVAHEINTPIGICVTAVSSINDKIEAFKKDYSAGNIRRSDFETFLKNASEAAQITLKNLSRTGDLVQSFKQVSVDQIIEERRLFNIKKYLEDVILAVTPKLKDKPIDIKIACDGNLTINSYPGVFAQIFTNLLLNAHIHAFSESGGAIYINIYEDFQFLKIEFADNGSGISHELLDKIYEPFFTSNKQTGTGLGLHIVYNLVTQKLGGEIACESAEGVGTKFTITLTNYGF